MFRGKVMKAYIKNIGAPGKEQFSFKRENQENKLNTGVRREERVQNDSQVSDLGGWLNGGKNNQNQEYRRNSWEGEKGNLYCVLYKSIILEL